MLGLMAPDTRWFFVVAEKPREAKLWQKWARCGRSDALNVAFRRLAGPGNLLGKPRLLIGLCPQLHASDDERRKGRSERIADLCEYDRGVGQR